MENKIRVLIYLNILECLLGNKNVVYFGYILSDLENMFKIFVGINV